MDPDDRETLDRLISEHHPPLLRLAIRLTGGVEPAEEIVQQTLLRVTQNWDGFRGQSGFKTWATRILLNVFSDRLARSRKSPPLADVPDSRQPDPASCAMAEELGRHIAARVSALPPRQREVLILLTYESHSAEEVAELLDMQVANVYSTLYQARQRLRAELAPFLTNSDGRSSTNALPASEQSAERCHGK